MLVIFFLGVFQKEISDIKKQQKIFTLKENYIKKDGFYHIKSDFMDKLKKMKMFYYAYSLYSMLVCFYLGLMGAMIFRGFGFGFVDIILIFASIIVFFISVHKMNTLKYDIWLEKYRREQPYSFVFKNRGE